MTKVHVKKGDNVLVLAGKDKGKKGKIIKVLPKEQRAVVEGVNMVKKHQKPTAAAPQGGIIEKEMPIAASNLLPICGKCHKATRVGHTILADGNKVRVCKKCNEILDK